jgi:hypothetical protein
MFHLYEVDTDEGPVKMIAALPPEAAQAGLPSPAVAGSIPSDAVAITLENFTANQEFSDFLNFVIAKHGASDPALGAQAEAAGDGWIYMVDLRIALDNGADEEEVEAVDTEDIIGAFRVEGGRVVPGSYRGNPNHRLLSERGLVQLDGWVSEKLVEELLALG